jgi:ferredoxin, 2Fe-2S
MPKVTFIEDSNGSEHVVEVGVGLSVMQAAKLNGVPGIDGDCGGCCICGTCHVYVEPAWRQRTGERTDFETATLEFAENVQANSRLGCQINMTEALDGLVVRVPGSDR